MTLLESIVIPSPVYLSAAACHAVKCDILGFRAISPPVGLGFGLGLTLRNENELSPPVLARPPFE